VSHNRYPATFGSSFIYRAAQGGIIHEKNVCLSVRPSVGVNCDKTKDTSAHITYHMKERLHCFPTTRMVGGGLPLVPEILGQSAKLPIFNRYSLVVPQPHLAKKVQLSLIRSPLRAFE